MAASSSRAFQEEDGSGAHGDAMETRMLARGFAARTRHAYLGWMRRLVRFSRTPADQLSEQQALEYVADLTRRGRSGSTINQALGAIKFFYTEVVAREWALSTRYQRFPQRLPVVLRQRGDAAIAGGSRRAAGAGRDGDRLCRGAAAERAAAAQGERHRLRADGDSREAGQGEEGSRGDAGSLAAGDAARLLATRPRGFLFPGKKGDRPLDAAVLQRGFERLRTKSQESRNRLVFIRCAIASPRI